MMLAAKTITPKMQGIVDDFFHGKPIIFLKKIIGLPWIFF